MVSKVLRGEGWEVGGDQGRDRTGVNGRYVGYVATRDGDYCDALTKKHPTESTLLLLVETTGAMCASLVRLIRGIGTQARPRESRH